MLSASISTICLIQAKNPKELVYYTNLALAYRANG